MQSDVDPVTDRPTCVSGGAAGSDLMWGHCAASIGHKVVHYSFKGHRTKAPPATLVRLSEAMLAQADDACRRANQTLGRRFPPDRWAAQPDDPPTRHEIAVANLLRRNWYQARDTTGMYGITALDRHGKVAGGTAWAIQMFIDRHNGAACPCYVFCQEAGKWFEWSPGWRAIYQPPMPSEVWAGIGSRVMVITGKLAIQVLLGMPTSPRRV